MYVLLREEQALQDQQNAWCSAVAWGTEKLLPMLISEQFCLLKALKTSVSQLFTLCDVLRDHTFCLPKLENVLVISHDRIVCASLTGTYCGIQYEKHNVKYSHSQNMAIFGSVCVALSCGVTFVAAHHTVCRVEDNVRSKAANFSVVGCKNQHKNLHLLPQYDFFFWL